MEEDCEELLDNDRPTQNMADISQLFVSFSHQMSSHMDQLQAQLQLNNQKISQAQDSFKQEVRAELDELRSLIATQQQTSLNITPPTPSIKSPSAPSPVSSGSNMFPNLTLVTGTASPNIVPMTNAGSLDVLPQMMLMLTESFSKLSTVLGDRTQETKSDWPKFSGNMKKFRAWYLSIMAQISLPPWQEFATKNDIMPTTTNSVLNGKLYAKLIVALEGQALQDVISKMVYYYFRSWFKPTNLKMSLKF